MTRDSQKHLVYEAEQEVRRVLDWNPPDVEVMGSRLPTPQERKFADILSVQTYCDCALMHVGRLPEVTVRPRKGTRFAHYQGWDRIIAVPPHVPGRGSSWAMREIVLLHELAHHLAPGDQHGEEFVSAFVHLVTTVWDPVAGLMLTGC